MRNHSGPRLRRSASSWCASRSSPPLPWPASSPAGRSPRRLRRLAIGVGLYVKAEPKPPAEPVLSRVGGDRRRILVVASRRSRAGAQGEVVRRAGRGADVLVVTPRSTHRFATGPPTRTAPGPRPSEGNSASRWPPSRRRASRRAARSATPTRCRRWTTPSGPSAPTGSSLDHPAGPVELAGEGVIEQARGRYPVPITHVVVDLAESGRRGRSGPQS